jgi:hypothetical protein
VDGAGEVVDAGRFWNQFADAEALRVLAFLESGDAASISRDIRGSGSTPLREQPRGSIAARGH